MSDARKPSLTCLYHYDVGAGPIAQGCGSKNLTRARKGLDGTEVTCLNCGEFYDPSIEHGADWERRFFVETPTATR